MALFYSRHKLDFYRDTPKGKILRTLTLNDITFWATDAFVAIVLILYVITHIEGGSATHLGLGYLMYKGTGALLSIPAGRFFDKHKGHMDEVLGLAVASFLYGAAYMFLSFSSQLWEMYLVMFILGCMSVVNVISWRTLFFNSIEREEYSETIGTYQAVISLAQGLALALGGFVGDTFGFKTVVFFGGLVIFLGGFLPLGLRYLAKKKKL